MIAWVVVQRTKISLWKNHIMLESQKQQDKLTLSQNMVVLLLKKKTRATCRWGRKVWYLVYGWPREQGRWESPIYYPAVTKRRLSQGVPRSCSRDLRILVCMQTNLSFLSMVAGEECRPYLGEVGLAAKLQTSHLPLCMVAPPPTLHGGTSGRILQETLSWLRLAADRGEWESWHLSEFYIRLQYLWKIIHLQKLWALHAKPSL